MNSKECFKIYDCLSRKGRKGVSILTLSRETNLPSSTVRECLSKFTSVFSKVGQSESYTINRLRSVSDPRKLLVEEIEKYRLEKTYFWLGFAVFATGIAVYISVISFNGI